MVHSDDRRRGSDTAGRDDRTMTISANFGPNLVTPVAPVPLTLTQEEASAVSALPSGSALLIVQRGPNEGARFLLDSDEASVGRHPDADIFLDDVTVSRRHAKFLRHGTQFEVKDLGSLNGTYYRGARIDHATLEDGSEVQIGKYILTFFASRRDLPGGVAD